MDISIVVPVYNEEESLGELREWIESILSAHSFSYEVIFVDDGSNDASWKVIEELSGKYAAVKGIRFRRNYGKAAALYKGSSRSCCQGSAQGPVRLLVLIIRPDRA